MLNYLSGPSINSLLWGFFPEVYRPESKGGRLLGIFQLSSEAAHLVQVHNINILGQWTPASAWRADLQPGCVGSNPASKQVLNLWVDRIRGTDVRDMGSGPVGGWHNASSNFNPKQLQQLSSCPRKLPAIFKIHLQRNPQARIMCVLCNRTYNNVRSQNKYKKRVASAITHCI